jgi:hypothetical protein
MVPLAGQVSRPFLGSGRAEISSAVNCAGVSLFRPSALKFSAVTPRVFCTSGDQTAIAGFAVVFGFGFAAAGGCWANPTCPDIITPATNAPETRLHNAIRLKHPPCGN